MSLTSLHHVRFKTNHYILPLSSYSPMNNANDNDNDCNPFTKDTQLLSPKTQTATCVGTFGAISSVATQKIRVVMIIKAPVQACVSLAICYQPTTRFCWKFRCFSNFGSSLKQIRIIQAFFALHRARNSVFWADVHFTNASTAIILFQPLLFEPLHF